MIVCLLRPWNWFGVLELVVDCAAFVVLVLGVGVAVLVLVFVVAVVVADDDGICQNRKWRLQWRCNWLWEQALEDGGVVHWILLQNQEKGENLD